ncbi:MAG: T9SS type A sorting domain-containing protein [Ignavibacteriaceae bacterium]|nr:T9SS type A sorting domain-containing protein [Ignavibacteriaceae bacterium]
MSKKLLVFFLLISLGSISAQKYSGKLNPFPLKSSKTVFNGDTLRILAVMVNFQEDNDASTFGTGKFGSIYTQNYGDKILDPLPHDTSYFKSHLKFAQNYFRKVSNGKLNITYNVLPDTLTVSKVMKDYTTISTSTDFSPLGNFAAEVWTLAGQHYTNVDFSGYDLFIVFHAGVGRDLTLPGSLGNEKDLPSVFLGLDALKKIYGSSFTGFTVPGGSALITNSLILPETENREVSNFGQTALFQITINGLITASIASYLGLPDLFDTNTGLSAIGRFGLMDGQAIFSYSGLFPPEPSAWEKIFLGWAQPVTVAPGVYNINLVSKLAASLADTVILKVPINSSEYFLVENRERDVNANGSVLTIQVGGQSITKTFDKDTDGYYSFAVDSVYGVVTDVDEYDWSLPGWITDTSDYKGGILIWHIDDNVINAKIATDQINTDINNRGVELVEANGVKEIGQKFTDIFGDLVIGEGSYEDYFFSANPGVIYKNRFDKDSRPNSNTHSGANSLIAMSGFSNSANKMSFNLAYGDSVIKPVFADSIPNLSINFTRMTSTGKRIFVANENNLFASDNYGNLISVPISLSDYKPASIFIDSVDFVFGVKDSFITIARYSAGSSVPVIQTTNVHKLLSCSPVIRTNGTQKELLVGTDGGYILVYNIDPSLPTGIESTAAMYWGNTSFFINSIDADNNYIAAKLSSDLHTSGPITIINDNQKSITINDVISQMSLTKSHGNYTIVALGNSGFYLISNGILIRKIPLFGTINSFALADLKNDGDNYIIYSLGNQVHAINLTGAEAVNFPFTNTDSRNFTGTPLTSDFEGDNKSEVIAYTEDGRIFAIDGGTGKVVTGFPISSGKMILASVIYNDNGKTSLAVIDSAKHFYGWHIGSTAGTPYWVEQDGNNMNSSFVAGAVATNYVNEFFPKGKVYNYPNPVYNGQTSIRYYVSEDSKINIKIFDLAGDFVAELNNNAQGGYESETVWKVNNIQSGIYLARVEAIGSSGKTESNIIKIAVVK